MSVKNQHFQEASALTHVYQEEFKNISFWCKVGESTPADLSTAKEAKEMKFATCKDKWDVDRWL